MLEELRHGLFRLTAVNRTQWSSGIMSEGHWAESSLTRRLGSSKDANGFVRDIAMVFMPK